MNDLPLEAMDGLIYNAEDSLLRMMVMDGQARVMMCRTTRMAQMAADTHLASDVAASALGRVLPAAAFRMRQRHQLGPKQTIRPALYRGPSLGEFRLGRHPGLEPLHPFLGKITAVGRGDTLKITVDNPQAQLPLLPDGRQDVPGFIGSRGRLTVIKDFGAGEPYVGTSQLVSGGVAEDLTQYFTVSEQTPSLLALGCLNQDGIVLSSGGILIQAMPGCSDETLDQLEMRIPFFAGISREIYDRSMEELARAWFRDMDLQILSSNPLHFACDCSREKMRAALIATGEKELRDMIAQNKDVEMVCWFCRDRQHFAPEEIQALLDGARQEE